MKKRKYLRIMGFLVIISLLAAACSKKAAYDTADVMNDSSAGNYGSATTESSSYTVNEEAPAAPSDTGYTDKNTDLNSTMQASGSTTVQPQDKIIRTFYMDIETQEFDSLITRVDSEIKRLGGYVENSQVSGKRYSYTDEARYGKIIARVPSEKVDEFVTIVGDNANVVNKQESTENVSLQYIEAESRIETLKIEQERLFAILDQEVSLDNIIMLESRLSDIRYELQNYESQLRYYDNQVAYSTITMSIQEVEKYTPVTEIKQSVGTRIKNGFSDTMFKISEGFQNFFVWFVVNLPYLLIWAIIIAAILIIVRRVQKKSKAKERTLPPPPPMIFNGPQNMGQSTPGQYNQAQPMQNVPGQSQQNQGQQNQNQQNPGQLK